VPDRAKQSLQTIAGGYLVLSARGIRTTHVPIASAIEAGALW